MTQLVGWPLFAAALLASAERAKNLQSLLREWRHCVEKREHPDSWLSWSDGLKQHSQLPPEGVRLARSLRSEP